MPCLALRALSVTAALTLAASHAHAAAFQLREGDPDWMANAFAGVAAKAYDAGSAWNNPAGMTLLTASEIDSGFQYFDPGIRFQGENVVNGVAVRGGNGGDAAFGAVTAGSESVWSYSPRLKFGLAVEGPFGLRTSYPTNFVGRYQTLVSAIEDFQIAPSVAYQLTPALSIGGGPVVSYFRARLTQAINTSIFLPSAGDATVDIRGDDLAAGYNVGALYQFTPALRIGADYHSRIGQNVVGKQQATVPALLTQKIPFVAAVVQALNQDVTTQIALPDYLTISGYYDVTPEWAVMATAQWTHWGLIKTLTVNTPTSEEATPIGFRNTWMESAGINWRPAFFPALMLQTGVLYDEGANTNATRGPRLPDEDRIGATGGFTYQLTPRMSLRASYLHEFPAGSNNVNYSNNFPNAGRLNGTFADNADVVSAGIAMKF